MQLETQRSNCSRTKHIPWTRKFNSYTSKKKLMIPAAESIFSQNRQFFFGFFIITSTGRAHHTCMPAFSPPSWMKLTKVWPSSNVAARVCRCMRTNSWSTGLLVLEKEGREHNIARTTTTCRQRQMCGCAQTIRGCSLKQLWLHECQRGSEFFASNYQKRWHLQLALAPIRNALSLSLSLAPFPHYTASILLVKWHLSRGESCCFLCGGRSSSGSRWGRKSHGRRW